MTEKVKIKSNGRMLELWLNDRCSYSELRSAIIEKLSVNKSFYSQLGQAVMIYGKLFSDAQKRELKNMLLMDFDLTETYFVDDDVPPSVQQAEQKKQEKADNTENQTDNTSTDKSANDADDVCLVSTNYFDAKSIFVNQTVRNGMRIECEGDVVVIGDVNAGAEIIAGGSVAIFGRLRGLVHAGAKGRTDVVVITNSLQANQIRIAGKIAVLPAKRQVDYPELAKLIDDRIVITALN